MRFRVVLVCYRCGERRGVVIRHEKGKKRGYCRQCARFLRGEISEAEAPRLKHALGVPLTGWIRG
jgi:hypothetical protein